MADPVGSDAGAGSPVERLFAALVAGAICGVLAVVLSIGAGALVFSSSLHSQVPVSIGMALAAAAVVTLIVALTSSIRGAVSPVQEVPVIALAAVVAAVVSVMPADATPQATLATAIVAIVIATFVAGLGAAALGYFRLGRIVHFIPYPVIGGFLAGTGWLIVVGAIGLVLGEEPDIDSLDRLADTPVVLNLALVALLVAILAWIEARSTHALMLPAAVVLTLILFNLGAALLGLDAAALHDIGWVIEVPEDDLWPPIGADDLLLVNWDAVMRGMLSVPTMVVMTVISFLMNASGIELETRTDVDLDRELRSVGTANMAGGVVGGMFAFPAVSLTLLAKRLGSPTRLVGVIVAIMLLAALVLDHLVLDVIPTFLLAAILIWVGGSLLLRWLVFSWRNLDRWEYLVILMIVAVIVGVDFATGIALGLIATVVLFVIQYARVETVRLSITGRDYHSSAAGSEEHRRLLRTLGNAILIFRLQGFLFFGTADRLRRSLANHAAAAAHVPVRFMLIDFGRVTGVDSSTVSSFAGLLRVAERDGFTIVLSGVGPQVRAAMQRGGLDMETSPNLRFEADFEAALKWCEDSLLAELRPEFSSSRPRPLSELLTGIVGDEAMAARLAPYFDRMEVPPGTLLTEEGAPSDDVYLVEAGYGAVEMRSDLGAPIRVATMGPGSILGELSYYLQAPRSASVVSQGDMVIWRLGRTALDRLKSEAPDIAFRFHEGMARMLSDRLQGTNRVVRFLAD